MNPLKYLFSARYRAKLRKDKQWARIFMMTRLSK